MSQKTTKNVFYYIMPYYFLLECKIGVIMNNILKELKEVEKARLNESQIIQLQKLFDELKKYWFIYDMDRETNHLSIFTALYISDNKMSLIDITEKYFIGHRTLDRYVSRCNRLAYKLIKIKFPELLKLL